MAEQKSQEWNKSWNLVKLNEQQKHTILKVKFLSKNSILTKKPTFSRVFHPNFFWQFFSWNQSCHQLRSLKPQHFHEFFTPIKIDNFLGKSKLNFWTKNEDFEQCAERKRATKYSLEDSWWITSDFFEFDHEFWMNEKIVFFSVFFCLPVFELENGQHWTTGDFRN